MLFFGPMAYWGPFEYWGWFLVGSLVGAGFSLALYIAMRNTWPAWPRLIHSLWFCVAALGVIGFPATFLRTILPYQEYSWNGYTLVAVFGLCWLTLAVGAAIVTALARALTRRMRPPGPNRRATGDAWDVLERLAGT